MFPEVNLQKYSRLDALKVLLRRFAYRMVWFDADMAKNYYKLPAKDIKAAIADLQTGGVLTEADGGYILTADLPLLQSEQAEPPKSAFAMHRNDILVKAYEPLLKEKYPHTYPGTLYYLLIDGEWHGAVVGKFRYTPEHEDVIVDLPPAEAAARRDEILAAIGRLNRAEIKRYNGEDL
jgi:hypothetical protein